LPVQLRRVTDVVIVEHSTCLVMHFVASVCSNTKFAK